METKNMTNGVVKYNYEIHYLDSNDEVVSIVEAKDMTKSEVWHLAEISVPNDRTVEDWKIVKK